METLLLETGDILVTTSFPSPEQLGAELFAGNLEILGRFLPLIVALIIWEFVWKGIALRKAGTKKQLWRFIAMFIINSVGILPILYLLFFQKKDEK